MFLTQGGFFFFFFFFFSFFGGGGGDAADIFFSLVLLSHCSGTDKFSAQKRILRFAILHRMVVSSLP